MHNGPIEKDEEDQVARNAITPPLSASYTPGLTTTRIVYNRDELVFLSNSPLAKRVPANLPQIPGVTCDEDAASSSNETARPARRYSSLI